MVDEKGVRRLPKEIRDRLTPDEQRAVFEADKSSKRRDIRPRPPGPRRPGHDVASSVKYTFSPNEGPKDTVDVLKNTVGNLDW